MNDKLNVLHADDNVGTALYKLEQNELISYKKRNEPFEVTTTEDIPLGHKVALCDFAKNASIIKYGEVIGEAREKIAKGALVHVHNVDSLRGRGDLTKGEMK